MREEKYITVSQEFDFWDMDRELWSGAKDRWKDADLKTREAVWGRICDYVACFEDAGDVVPMCKINDLVWFNCDDLFFPEEYDDEECNDEEDEED